jgi:hypothetical protein
MYEVNSDIYLIKKHFITILVSESPRSIVLGFSIIFVGRKYIQKIKPSCLGIPPCAADLLLFGLSTDCQ